MINCPKCGFKNDQQQATNCPKCGLIYAKFQKTQAHKSIEQTLSDSFSNAMPSEYKEESRFADFESQKDQDSYSAIVFLSGFFNIFAGLLGIIWVAGIIVFWSFLSSTQYFQGSPKVIVTLFFAMFSFLPIAMYASISGALKLGKDIADNTRATRNYLAHLTKTKNK
jgi:hypothetical protein